MYNGIGLQTARGSGTNGYVQRNLSFVKQMKKPIEYKSEDDFKKLEKELNRVPNKEILEHQNKRQIELKCLEMEDQMEQQGFTAQEIEAKVKEFRETLITKMESSVRKKSEWISDNFTQNLKETHKMAEVNHQKNDQIKNALNISTNFIVGSSLDPTRRAAEAAERALRKQYALVKDPEIQEKSSSVENKDVRHKSHEKYKSNKKRNSRTKSSDSESDSKNSDSDGVPSRKRHQNSSKDKRNKESKKHKTKDRKYSESSSDSDSSDSDSSSDSESSDSSDSYDQKSKSRKNRDSKRERRKHSSSPDVKRNRNKSYSDLKDSTHDSNQYNKTSHSIAMNIRQMRKESQNCLTIDRRLDSPNNEKQMDVKKDNHDSSPKSKTSPHRRHSRSSSHSSERDSRVKRLKSAVYEISAAKKVRELPKSYDEKRYESKKERSLTPNQRSRHSSRSERSVSRSDHSTDSKSSDRSSRSRSYSASKSSSKSSKSSSRSKSRSRSVSIPRRKGSPSFLDKRRITSARKRPIPYRRGSPTSSLHSSRSSRSMSGCNSPSLSVSSSSDSFNSNTYEII